MRIPWRLLPLPLAGLATGLLLHAAKPAHTVARAPHPPGSRSTQLVLDLPPARDAPPRRRSREPVAVQEAGETWAETGRRLADERETLLQSVAAYDARRRAIDLVAAMHVPVASLTTEQPIC
jgi:hypothetical protein